MKPSENDNAGAEKANGLEPRFRAITVDGKRYGIRLERLFWDLLDKIALAKGVRRADVVAEVVNDHSESAGNLASRLRGFIVRWLSSEVENYRDEFSQQNVVVLLHQAPVPAFAINRQRLVWQVNAEFLQMLRGISDGQSEDNAPGTAQIRLETSVDQLFVELNKTPSVSCNYAIQFKSRTMRGVARMVPVPDGRRGPSLVGYVVRQ